MAQNVLFLLRSGKVPLPAWWLTTPVPEDLITFSSLWAASMHIVNIHNIGKNSYIQNNS